MRIAVLRNPTSGRGAGTRRRSEVARLLPAADAFETRSAEDLSLQARRCVEEGYDVVVAAGGDGTLNRAAQALVGTPTALAVLPLGTGNDFARTLGLLSVEHAVEALRDGRTESLDVGRWRQGEGEGYFLNVAGCGFDAAVADRINRGFRRLRGRAAYLAGILDTLRDYRPLRLSMSLDGGEPLEAEAMLCAFANAQSYGAGLRVAPTADLQDGLLDLVLVGPLGRLEFLRNLPGVSKGRHLDHPKVLHRRFRRLAVESDPPTPFLIDGELLPTGRVEIEAVPRALRMIVPEGFGTP